jgi:leucyl-tRNA synthetase
MELVNEIYVSEIKERSDEAAIRVMREAVETVVILLSPFVPHFTEELWQALGNGESIIIHPWPEVDPEMVAEEEILIVIQVNGKLRDRMTVPAAYGEEQVKEWALKSERIKALLGGKPVRRVIFVPQKLVNIVC